jgi:hypothetical protein
MVTKCNSFPCTATKIADEDGISEGRGKLLVSVRALGKRSPADCKTVYPGSSHRNRGLTVLQIAIFTRSHGWIFGLAPWGDTFDYSIVVGLLKKGN